jgi:hypothetical protein
VYARSVKLPSVRVGAAIVVSLALLVGVAGAAVALHARGGQELFRDQQSRSLAITPVTVVVASSVQAVVARAPEPVIASRRTPPAVVRCRPGGGGPLRNPWSCTIRYRSGTRAHYRVLVQPNGYYKGVGTGIIEGCCVKVPTLD